MPGRYGGTSGAGLDSPRFRGVLVADVQAGTPAARAGLKKGDVIIKLAGREVEGAGQFRNAIAASGAGASVQLQLLRGGEAVALDVALAEMPRR